MYLQTRHERAMVRLCALLWILKLEEDRSTKRRDFGRCEGGGAASSHHEGEGCSSRKRAEDSGEVPASASMEKIQKKAGWVRQESGSAGGGVTSVPSSVRGGGCHPTARRVARMEVGLSVCLFVCFSVRFSLL